MRVLSGTQPTGAHLHIGNYLGALRQYVEFQDTADEALYFIADYHSMTTVRDAKVRRENSLAVALDYLAAGLDPERALLFLQSDVPQVCGRSDSNGGWPALRRRWMPSNRRRRQRLSNRPPDGRIRRCPRWCW